MGGNGAIFIEGDSEIIDEEDEHNTSLDHVRRKSIFRGNKSLDDFDAEDVDNQVSQVDFVKGLKSELE
jgi:hypothetical protein